MSPASNLMPEMCCMGKHLDRNDIDIVFRSTCGPKENHLNFLKFVKSLVALSLKLYPRHIWTLVIVSVMAAPMPYIHFLVVAIAKC